MVGRIAAGERIVIIGKPGTGKSTLVETLTCESWRVVYFCTTLDDYHREGRKVLTVWQLKREPWRLQAPHLRLVVEPTSDDPSDVAYELRELVKLIRKYTADLVLVMDEAGDYSVPGSGIILSVVRRCRHDRMGVILSSQCATDIPLRARKMATVAYLFGQDHPDELAAIEKVYGENHAIAAKNWQKYDPPSVWRAA